MNPIALRLLNQQLVAPQFKEPEEVVRSMGAMQAQEYRMMRWAVAMRTSRPPAKKFKAAYDNGRIIRMHLMRGTWQLVAAENYWAWLMLCGNWSPFKNDCQADFFLEDHVGNLQKEWERYLKFLLRQMLKYPYTSHLFPF